MRRRGRTGGRLELQLPGGFTGQDDAAALGIEHRDHVVEHVLHQLVGTADLAQVIAGAKKRQEVLVRLGHLVRQSRLGGAVEFFEGLFP